MNQEVFEVPINDILPNRFQPREKFDKDALNDLAESIKRYGLIQPLVVRRLGNKYEIIAGERRYKASVIAGVTKIPVVLKDLDDEESAEVALVENIQRQNLTPIEEARSYNKLLNMGGATQDDLAKKLGVAQPTVANKIRLLNLSDEVQDALLDRKISERHARSLLKINNKQEQNEMLEKIINQRMTVRQLDDEITKKTGIASDETLDEGEDPGGEPKIIQGETQEEALNVPQSPPGPNLGTSTPVIENESTTPTDDISAVANRPEPINISPEPSQPNNELNEINVEKLKEDAQDINVDNEKPNFDMLLKPEEEINETTAEAPPTTSVDEQMVPDNQFAEQPIENQEVIDVSQTSQPQPNFESLIKEYKEERGLPANDNVPQSPLEPTPVAPAAPEEINEPVTQTYVTGDLRTAINTVRKSIETIEKYGFKVDSEEFDFEDMYQVIIKIDKKKE
ncbi:MAG: ParB/RepB/Spo0J family partition protein [Bacilli bacterium]